MSSLSQPNGEELAFDLHLVRLCQLSATIIALYDHFLCIGQEVELIWKKGWSISKALYLVNRYAGDLGLIYVASVFLDPHVRDNFCYVYFRTQGWGGAAVLWATQTIMQFRLYAMYNRSFKILCLLGTCFFLEILILSIILGVSYSHMGATANPTPGVTICSPTNVPRYFAAFWVVIICFETIMCSLAAWIGISFIRAHGHWKTDLLLTVLLRDSIVYFFVCLSAYVTCAIVWYRLPPNWIEVPEGFALAFTVVMGSRLILNLREAYYLPFEDELDANGLWTNSEAKQPSPVDIAARLRAVPRPGSGHRTLRAKLSFIQSPTSTSGTCDIPMSPVTSFSPGLADTASSPVPLLSGKKSARRKSSHTKGDSDEMLAQRRRADAASPPPITWRWDERSGRLSDRESSISPAPAEDDEKDGSEDGQAEVGYAS